MDTYISGMYHAITCKFQWHLCVPARMGFAWLTLLIKTHLARHIYCQLTVHNNTHALARLHEKCGKTLDTGTGQLRSPNPNPFLLLQHQGLVFLFICTHFKSNVSNTSIHCSEHGSKFHRSAINLLQVQLFSFLNFVSYSKTI